MILASLAIGCSGEPFRLDPSSSEPEPRARGGPARPTRARVSLEAPGPLAPMPISLDLMFARRGIQELVVLDGPNGAVVTSHTLSGPLVDLAWSEPEARLLALTSSPSGDASRLESFEPTATGLVSRAARDDLPPATRVEPFADRWLVLSEDMGVSWALHDAALAPHGPSKLLVRPSGLFVAETRNGTQATALNPNLLVDGQDADEIVGARFTGSWQIERESFDATGRPDSRLARRPGSDHAFVVRKAVEGFTFQIGEFSAVAPCSPPWFETRIVPGAIGSLDAVVVDDAHHRLIALLARQSEPGAIALVPLDDGPAGSVTTLSAPVETSPWPSRQMVLRDSETLWVATNAGLERLRVDGDTALPAGTFAEVGAPLVAWTQ